MPNRISVLTISAAIALTAMMLAACTPSGNGQQPAAATKWSGVWALTDDSFWAANLDAYGGKVPLTPKYQQMRAQARAERRQANQSSCLPAGATAVFQHGILFEMLFTPGRITILYEDGEVRSIHTDGRSHMDLKDLRNSFMGDSIGHWEGDTLVVNTIGFPNGELWQNHGVRATINTRLDERFFLNAKDELQIDSVMTDPEIFSALYKYTRINTRQTLPLGEPSCLQNNRDTGTEIDLTPPQED